MGGATVAILPDAALSDTELLRPAFLPDAKAGPKAETKLPFGEVAVGVSFVHTASAMIYRRHGMHRVKEFDHQLETPCSRGLHGFLSDRAPDLPRWIESQWHQAAPADLHRRATALRAARAAHTT